MPRDPNVLERAVILSQGGPLRFEGLSPDFALPLPTPPLPPSPAPAAAPTSDDRLSPSAVLTRAELKQREAQNIRAALQQTEGKVFGPDGAAALLGMKPTTLASRIKALRLEKQRK